MRRKIVLVILTAGSLLLSLAQMAHAGVLGIGKIFLRTSPWVWFWTGIQGLMKLLEAHPTATKAILGASLAAQLLGIIRGKTTGFPWTLFLLAVTLLAIVALVVLLRRR
jgi:hypothetical protein